MDLILGSSGGYKIKRHRVGRFVKNSQGSDFMRPLHGSRHRDRQVRRLAKGKAFKWV